MYQCWNALVFSAGQTARRQASARVLLTTLLLGDSDSLTAAASGLCVLTTHTHAPVVAEATVAPDLPEPVKVLTDLEVQTVGKHLDGTQQRADG